jgi:hypothetical protein
MSSDPLIDRWQAHRAAAKLEEFWNQTAPAGVTFDQAEAVAMLMVKLECYETALRKIAGTGGPDAETANAALAYKPPVWR